MSEPTPIIMGVDTGERTGYAVLATRCPHAQSATRYPLSTIRCPLSGIPTPCPCPHPNGAMLDCGELPWQGGDMIGLLAALCLELDVTTVVIEEARLGADSRKRSAAVAINRTRAQWVQWAMRFILNDAYGKNMAIRTAPPRSGSRGITKRSLREFEAAWPMWVGRLTQKDHNARDAAFLAACGPGRPGRTSKVRPRRSRAREAARRLLLNAPKGNGNGRRLDQHGEELGH